MRVEHIGTPKSISESPQRQGLSQGDILVAEVTDIKGDQVYLKNQEGGGVLTAKLLSDIAVSVGDYVETVVDDASGGRYVLRVIDISHQMPFGSRDADLELLTAQSQSVRTQTLLNTLAMLKNNPGADPKAASFLSRHGFAGTAENLETLSEMAKGMPSVTALLAEVIESLGTMKEAAASATQTLPNMGNANAGYSTLGPQTKVNSDVTTQNMVSTDRTAEEMMPLQTSQQEQNWTVISKQTGEAVVRPEHAPTSKSGTQASAEPQTLAPSAAQENPRLAGQSTLQEPSANVRPPAHEMAGSHSQTLQIMGETAEQAQSPGNQAAPVSLTNPKAASQPARTADQALNTATSASETAAKTEATSMGEKTDITRNTVQSVKTVAEGKTEAAGISAQQKDAPMPKEMPQFKQIADKAHAMFVDINDKDKLAGHIKKAVQELPQQLKELKLLIEHTDNTVKEKVAAKFDQIEKQMSMLSEVKRFDCYQIPLQTSPQQQKAAELYVYRYRGNKKTVDPENILILLGLDMEYMGRVETLIKTSGKNLSIEFNLEDMRLGEEIKADAAYLKQAAEDAGYRLSDVSVKELAARTTVLNAQGRLETEAGGSAANVDVRI